MRLYASVYRGYIRWRHLRGSRGTPYIHAPFHSPAKSMAAAAAAKSGAHQREAIYDTSLRILLVIPQYNTLLALGAVPSFVAGRSLVFSAFLSLLFSRVSFAQSPNTMALLLPCYLSLPVFHPLVC